MRTLTEPDRLLMLHLARQQRRAALEHKLMIEGHFLSLLELLPAKFMAEHFAEELEAANARLKCAMLMEEQLTPAA